MGVPVKILSVAWRSSPLSVWITSSKQIQDPQMRPLICLISLYGLLSKSTCPSSMVQYVRTYLLFISRCWVTEKNTNQLTLRLLFPTSLSSITPPGSDILLGQVQKIAQAQKYAQQENRITHEHATPRQCSQRVATIKEEKMGRWSSFPSGFVINDRDGCNGTKMLSGKYRRGRAGAPLIRRDRTIKWWDIYAMDSVTTERTLPGMQLLIRQPWKSAER